MSTAAAEPTDAQIESEIANHLGIVAHWRKVLRGRASLKNLLESGPPTHVTKPLADAPPAVKAETPPPLAKTHGGPK